MKKICSAQEWETESTKMAIHHRPERAEPLMSDEHQYEQSSPLPALVFQRRGSSKSWTYIPRLLLY